MNVTSHRSIFTVALVMFSGSALAQHSVQEQAINAIAAVQLERALEAMKCEALKVDPLDLKLNCGAISDEPAPVEEPAPDDQYHEIAMSALGQSPAPSTAPAAPSEASGGQDEASIAEKAQNPIADMISVPFKSNFNFGVGPNDVVQYVLEVEPVIPVHLSDEWNLITRTIVPIANFPSPAPGISSEFGLGDIQFSGFFSPSKPSKVTWGFGPIFQFPSASDDLLGQGKWCVGPTAVLVVVEKPWLLGVLINQLWSFAGDNDREDVNQMLVQPFINFNMPHGWYLVTSPIFTADWEAASSDTWTVPIGGGVGKIAKLFGQHININLQAYYNVEKPDNGPEWQLLFEISLLFPEH